MSDLFFPHERLDCYQLARDVAQWIATVDFPDADLRNQASRASRSIALNIAEGSRRSGKSRRYHFDVAAGSAAETCAALDFVADAAAQQEKLRRVGLMLRKLR